ncbi:hypothetical protein WS70_28040 [Burkholderia mayonis]|uniref:Uncharacterized protein n=1 Tax=Burkholderia mayonis TaxID=1385591 RepID=A0A1B4FPC4_9BURK|nr:hypothetical protein WS70_28040 [Burkholderia mayonis]KVE47761.1 hypothetical protein WS70_24720 [Burkholderia mayonis]
MIFRRGPFTITQLCLDQSQHRLRLKIRRQLIELIHQGLVAGIDFDDLHRATTQFAKFARQRQGQTRS